MVDDKQLETLALALPEVIAGQGSEGKLVFEVGGKGLAWAYRARPAPKTRRVLIPGVIAIRCALETKEMLIEAAPDRFFDDAHYKGFPAVLVRLAAVEADELAGLLRQAWKIVAPKTIAKKYQL